MIHALSPEYSTVTVRLHSFSQLHKILQKEPEKHLNPFAQTLAYLKKTELLDLQLEDESLLCKSKAHGHIQASAAHKEICELIQLFTSCPHQNIHPELNKPLPYFRTLFKIAFSPLFSGYQWQQR